MPASLSSFEKTVVLGTPALLGLIEIGHPALLPGQKIFETVRPLGWWWTALHLAQIPLFALMGIAVLLLVRDLDGLAARTSRWAIAVFIVVYPAFDAAVGVASGVVVHALGSVDPAQRGTVDAALQALFWGPVTGSMAIVGSACWLVGLAAAAWAWHRESAPLYTVAALASAGVLLAVTHVRPFGSLACLSFLVGAGWIACGRSVSETMTVVS